MMIPTPANGILKGVNGIDAALQVPGVRSIEITTPVGARLRRVPELDRYLGFIFAAGPDPSLVEASLRQAHAGLAIDIT